MRADTPSKHWTSVAAIVVGLITTSAPGAEPTPASAPGDPPDSAVRLESRHLSIDVATLIDTAPGSGPRSLTIWYTTDGGNTWQRYGGDLPADQPVAFDAKVEGTYGFYVVARNRFGRSGPAPGPQTRAHVWAVIDDSAPRVSLKPVVRSVRDGRRVAAIRWTARDAHLTPAPVELAFRPAAAQVWTIIDEALPNTGAYDWPIPDSAVGAVEFQVTVRDRLGHETIERTEPVDVGVPAGVARTTVQDGADSGRPGGGDASRNAVAAGRSPRQAEVLRRYKSGVVHSLRGEYELATSDLRAALALNPEFTPALVEIGNVLYAQQRFAQAVEAYRIAVEQSPESAEALYGLAQALVGERRFADARHALDRLVRVSPEHGKAWLLLGDVARYEGRDSSAVEYFQRAIRFSATPDVARLAGDRLENLKRLADAFDRSTESP